MSRGWLKWAFNGGACEECKEVLGVFMRLYWARLYPTGAAHMRRTTLLIFLSLLLTACGQKGNLTLPVSSSPAMTPGGQAAPLAARSFRPLG